MQNLRLPNEITFVIEGLEDYWLDVHPLLFQIKTFAKNQVKVEDGFIWGRSDYYLSPLVVNDNIVFFSSGQLNAYAEVIRDLSAMEYLPIETHYPLVEIELMPEKAVSRYLGYIKHFSKNSFPYAAVLGNYETAYTKLSAAGNGKVNYYPFHQRVRDVWDDETTSKIYEFKISKKPKQCNKLSTQSSS